LNNVPLVRVITFALWCAVVLLSSAQAQSSKAQSPNAQTSTVTVFVTSKPANTFVVKKALGAGVDGLRRGEIAGAYTPHNLTAMKSAGLGALTYRLRTELGVEAWHWNPAGQWSEPGRDQGYWTSLADTKTPITLCNGYRLPRRGSTVDQANNDGYSRIDDGDANTFWKSNPYLDTHFTGEDNGKHPQWVLADLGRRRPVDALEIDWGKPYATRYRVQYWAGESGGDKDAQTLDDTFGDGSWRTFPLGVVTAGHGGLVRLRLTATPVSARYVRVWMTQSGGGPITPDIRDRVGYAVQELRLGLKDGRGRLQDWIRHIPDGKRQTLIYVSSTDPWHRASDRDANVEQPGFDRVFGSGLTRNLPLLTPTGLLYDTPENAVAELRFLRARGYPITRLELGEEPDGQYASPEDYGALYVQWAEALHRVDPKLKLGGPSFQTALDGWVAWPDAHGNRSWMNRFVQYLKKRGHLADFAFFSFEWYPFDKVGGPFAPQLALEPSLLENSLARLRHEGLPADIPWLISEYGYSAFAGQAEVDWPGGLLNAETAAQFLTLGGSAAYLYGYEPNTLISDPAGGSDTWGNLALWLAGDDGQAQKPLVTYYAARLLTQEWAQPGTDVPHSLYKTQVALKDRHGLPLVTAYTVHRPDGQWSVLLLNKDPKLAHQVTVQFQKPGSRNPLSFSGAVDVLSYSSAQYVWHPHEAEGYPNPDLPPGRSVQTTSQFSLPPFSISIVRGRVSKLP
jgi:hypothetical protein